MLAANYSFDEVLDVVECLSDDEQADLIEVVRRRLADRGRQRIVADAEEARREHAEGKTRPVSVDDLLREIASCSR